MKTSFSLPTHNHASFKLFTIVTAMASTMFAIMLIAAVPQFFEVLSSHAYYTESSLIFSLVQGVLVGLAALIICYDSDMFMKISAPVAMGSLAFVTTMFFATYFFLYI